MGYGKPPKESRFRPGESGNPRGRPRGVRNFANDVKATLRTPVKVAQNGKTAQVSTQRAMLLRLREKALAGDARALDRLLELARAYDDPSASRPSSLSGDDQAILDVYRTRLLSGAAGPGTDDEGP